MGKEFNFKTMDGKDLLVVCSSGNTSYGFNHKAMCKYNGNVIKTYAQYYNRTWETFRYESVLYKLLNKMFKGKELEFMNSQVKDIENKTREQANAWFDAWKKDYDDLSDETKKHLANSGVEIHSKEQADELMKISKVFDLLMKL